MKQMKFFMIAVFVIILLFTLLWSCADEDDGDSGDDDDDGDQGVADGYPVVDSDQSKCYDTGSSISCGNDFFGQDAQYDGYQPQYKDNGDGTVTDQVTGLMWQQDPGNKMDYDEAVDGADSFELAGYDDWRVPTIKELYSLILFSGEDPSGESNDDTSGLTPFIDDTIFAFEYGDTGSGERIIDSQWVTGSVYESTVMGNEECFFGVNFADGRIKCYPTKNSPSGYFAIYVRSADDYGLNSYQDNDDGTVNDSATDLLWQQGDSGEGMIWEDALDYCESLTLAEQDDWRLPNAKELQSIVDYSRSPDTTSSAAIDPIFSISTITNEAGDSDYPFFWTGTTHASSNGMGGSAAYISFGRALGYMNGNWIDVHGAGAQRSDPKTGDPSDYPEGHGPQGDAIRIYNYVRCVTDGGSSDATNADDDDDANDDDDDDSTQPTDDDDDMPPPEAVEACDGKTAGDDCDFIGMGGETVTGTCEQIGDFLACVPEGGPPVY